MSRFAHRSETKWDGSPLTLRAGPSRRRFVSRSESFGHRTIAVALAVVLPLSAAGAQSRAELRPTAREGAEHAVPLYGELIRPYDAPDDPFAPGHRGIDVAAPIGQAVRASARGVVSFAGSVAGNRTVTIDHGEGLLTSYSFLESATVSEGDTVSLGTVVGTVGRGHTNGDPKPHVHLSARRDGTYFDPLELYVGSSYAELVVLTA